MKKMLSGAALATAVVVAAPGVAHAATMYNKDAHGDTTRVKGSPSSIQRNQTDLGTTSFWKTSKGGLVVTFRLRDLRSDYRFPQLRLGGLFYNAVGSKTFRTPNGCTRTASVSYSSNTVTVQAPRSCFSGGTYATWAKAVYTSTSGATSVKDDADQDGWTNVRF